MQFPVKFVEWIKSCVTTSRLSVKVNGALEGFFKARTGLRQGDPLSPYLFVLAKEVLTACVDRSISSNQFSYHWRAKATGISHLVFADDLILFSKGVPGSINTLLRGVTSFSEILGLFPNPEKCTCFFGNVPIEVQESTLNATGFSKSTLPVTYLGLPLLSSKLNMRDCEALVMRLCKKN